MRPIEDRAISASEVAEYVYCHRAWWHRIQGAAPEQTERMEAGRESHDVFAADVREVERKRIAARTLLWLAAALVVALILARLLLS